MAGPRHRKTEVRAALGAPANTNLSIDTILQSIPRLASDSIVMLPSWLVVCDVVTCLVMSVSARTCPASSEAVAAESISARLFNAYLLSLKAGISQGPIRRGPHISRSAAPGVSPRTTAP